MEELAYRAAVARLLDEDSGVDKFFALAKTCSALLNGSQTENLGRDLIIRVLDSWDTLPEAGKLIWNDLIEAAGLYPYTEVEKLTGASALRQEYHRSEFLDELFLHSEQLKLSNTLQNTDKSLIVSAPTSFGKSLLIEELVASRKYSNMVVIQPTLALLDETRKKLQKYSHDYNIVVSTTQEFTPGRNLFLFTGERVVEYPEFPQIDFFVVDEFYKLSMDRDDERATSLNEAVYRLLKSTKKFYMLGPNIKNVPDGFADFYNAVWEKSDYATVAVDVERVYETPLSDVDFIYRDVAVPVDKVEKLEIAEDLKDQLFEDRSEQGYYFRRGAGLLIDNLPLQEYKGTKSPLVSMLKKATNQGVLFDLLISLKQPSLIYCSSPSKTFKVAQQFCAFLGRRGIRDLQLPDREEEILEWIGENINEGWSLAKALEFSIGIHNGIIPRHLSSSMVDSFNKGNIRYLFCTSTLIEGVNTSAKNVVLLDKKKGSKPIDYFDFKNISGRTGRMNIHYVGKVFQFHKEPKPLEIEVDIPLFTQENATVELLVQMDTNDIKAVAENRLDEFHRLEPSIQALLRHNKGVPIAGQLKILEIFRETLDENYGLINWTGIPKYDQLRYVLRLGWDHLRHKDESKGGVLSSDQLATITLQYCRHRSTKTLIRLNFESPYRIERLPNPEVRLQDSINTVLHVSQHWFNYKLPKWLAVTSEIQDFVCSERGIEPGDYTYLASILENSFVPQNLAILLEYGIPSSAIVKIGSVVKDTMPIGELVSVLANRDLRAIGLLDYEHRKVNSLIEGYK